MDVTKSSQEGSNEPCLDKTREIVGGEDDELFPNMKLEDETVVQTGLKLSQAQDFVTQTRSEDVNHHGQTIDKVGVLVVPRFKHERRLSLDENDLARKFISDTSPRIRAMAQSPNPGSSISISLKKKEVVDDYSFERSPVTPYRGKVSGKGALPASPFWERKVSTSGNQGSHFATPGRHQPKQLIHREPSPESPTLPKFGDWDESNPSAADGFTKVFDQVRDLKLNGGGTRVPSTSGVSSRSRQGTFNKSEVCCCCFSWGKQ